MLIKCTTPTTTATTLVQLFPTWAAEVSASLVSPPPLSPPTVHCPQYSQRDSMRTKSDPVPPLLRTFPWCPPHSERTQVPPQPTRLCIRWPHHLSNLTPPPPPSHPPLQSHWPPPCPSDTALPWGLSTGCSLRLEDSSPRYLYGPLLTSFKFAQTSPSRSITPGPH